MALDLLLWGIWPESQKWSYLIWELRRKYLFWASVSHQYGIHSADIDGACPVCQVLGDQWRIKAFSQGCDILGIPVVGMILLQRFCVPKALDLQQLLGHSWSLMLLWLIPRILNHWINNLRIFLKVEQHFKEATIRHLEESIHDNREWKHSLDYY